MKPTNYYRLLEIPRDATANDIKKAYRNLARELHPDVNTKKDAAEKFKAVGEAYAVLSDDFKRQVYDQTGRTDFSEGQATAKPFYPGRSMGACVGKCSGIEAIFRRGDAYKRRKAAARQKPEICSKSERS